MAATLSSPVLSVDISTAMSDVREGNSISCVAGKSITFQMTHGSGNGQASKIFVDEGRTLTSSTSVNLDIYDLENFDSTTDPLLNTLTFAAVKGIIVYNRTTSVGNLLVGGLAAGTAWSQIWNSDDAAKFKLPPGSGMFFGSNTAGWSVTDVTDHLLKVEASGGDCTYDVLILGV